MSHVAIVDDIRRRHRLKEAWPTRAAVEFRIGRKQRQSAADASVNADHFVIEQRAAERPLGALGASDLVLLWRELFLPFFVALFDARRIDFDEIAGSVEDGDFHSGEWMVGASR